jgi:23S rRNA maturation-related 3'-5' exoribonuclease YhaM
MANMEQLRQGVRHSLPELSEIQDTVLRNLVVDAWALALSQSEFERIEDIRASGNPESPALKNGTQADHMRGVAQVAIAMADAMESVAGPMGVDRDLLWACALCHDLGKPAGVPIRPYLDTRLFGIRCMAPISP